MQRGIILRHDADFDYAVTQKQQVEVRFEGEVDNIGRLFGYTRDTLVMENGDRYLRGNVEVKTI